MNKTISRCMKHEEKRSAMSYSGYSYPNRAHIQASDFGLTNPVLKSSCSGAQLPGLTNNMTTGNPPTLLSFLQMQRRCHTHKKETSGTAIPQDGASFRRAQFNSKETLLLFRCFRYQPRFRCFRFRPRKVLPCAHSRK